MCPRGSVLGELLGHRRRILAPGKRVDGQVRQLQMDQAYREILDAAGRGGITFILDPNLPCEQLSEAASWVQAWPEAKLCFAVEPAERELLLGTEASGAEYLSGRELGDCDGFLMIGDVFAANPICARGVFDRRKAGSRTPIVVIDPALGTTAKFATHLVITDVGGELGALTALAGAVGVDIDLTGGQTSKDSSSAQAAGAALGGCRKLAVLIVAEYGRSAAWREVGYLAGAIAKKLGGGVAPQTNGANPLAAVRLSQRMGTVSLASAMSPSEHVRVVLAVDVLGMLGWSSADEAKMLAAAAGLPNVTTDAAQIILPTTIPGEIGGTYLLTGQRSILVSPALAAPAGVPTPAEIIAALAGMAGIAKGDASAGADPLKRLKLKAPKPHPALGEPKPLALLLGRQAAQAGCGTLTGHGSWEAAIQPVPPLRISPQDARGMKLKHLGAANVACGARCVQARVYITPELAPGAVVLPEGASGTRALIPSKIDSENDTLVAAPATVAISPANGND